jgi:2,5-diketo-D-gluconate reductase A
MNTTLTLNNGVEMPALGLGVFQSPPEETANAVHQALVDGYRLIDTAAIYGNERQVGEGLLRSGLPREQVFIETKVWVSDYGYDESLHAWEKAVRKLGIEYIDLLLLHTPAPIRFEQTVQAYKALETLLAQGKVRAIGVSNFMPHHLDSLRAQTEVVPALNQFELHPYFTQPEVQRLDAELGLIDQAWSPIGGITRYPGFSNDLSNPLSDPTVSAIAAECGKTSAQVMIRWHLQRGRSAIPKSVNPARIRENFDVFDFELSNEQLTQLDNLDTGRRGGPDPDSNRAAHFDTVIAES